MVELKVVQFAPLHIGQLNTYVNYFKKEIKQKGDKAPIGILLVTNKNKPLVEYATAGMDNNLIVSTYLLKLPKKEKLAAFVKQELKKPPLNMKQVIGNYGYLKSRNTSIKN